MGAKYFGASVRRKEDPRYLRGEGRFVDDIKLPGCSTRPSSAAPRARAHRGHPHRRGQAAPGVAHVFTFADLERWMKPLPSSVPSRPVWPPRGRHDEAAPPARDVPGRGAARGEIVAMVVAGSRGVARTVASWSRWTTSRCPRWPTWRRPPPDAPCSIRPGATTSRSPSRPASATSRRRSARPTRGARALRDPALRGMPIETRGVVAQWDPRDGALTT